MPPTIRTRQEFLRFLADFSANYPAQSHPNQTLPDFLQAMHGWISDMDGYYRHTNQPPPFTETSLSWQNLADILQASAVYE